MSEPPPPPVAVAAAAAPPRRRPPPRPPRSGADVYVNMQTDFGAQLGRCRRLLGGTTGGDGGGPGLAELRIHGLGLAIPRAINIALQLEAGAGGGLRLHPATSTVRLTPGSQPPPSNPDGPSPAPCPRHNSAIHIRVARRQTQ